MADTGRARAHVAAEMIGGTVRDYVRDRFTPGDLASLNDLAKFVEELTESAIMTLRGKYNCRDCARFIDVAAVRCDVCSSAH